MPGPILESKSMRVIFQIKGKKGQKKKKKNVKNGKKSAKYLNIWAKMYKV